MSLYLGVDIGSATSKAVLIDSGKNVLAKCVVPSGAGTSGPGRAVGEVLAQASAVPAATVATGYGRSSFARADKTLSELSCHAIAARFLFPGARTVIDVGGQDAKVIRLGPDGRMTDFAMNDKCAAGTGRFLDVMSRVLELDVADMGAAGAASEHPAEISSTCTVFAESEVISRLAAGVPINDIVAGIHRSAAVRVASLAKRLGVQPPVVMTGGVAQNENMRFHLGRELGAEIQTHPLAQLAGALGAALYALETAEKK